ncbi:MAG: CBS domain-containing protein [Pseudobdellovibrionaceae bacterium]
MLVYEMKEFKENNLDAPIVQDSQTLGDALVTMEKDPSGMVMIAHGNTYLGTYTERMFLKDFMAGRFTNPAIPAAALAHDIPTIQYDDNAQACLEKMNAADMRALPVLNKDGAVMGLLRRSDFAALSLPQAAHMTGLNISAGLSSGYQPFLILAAILAYTAFIASVFYGA